MNKKQLIRLTEGDLHNIINESIKNILSEEDYIKYHKNPNPYTGEAKGDKETQPLKKHIYLDTVRARIWNIAQALKNNRIEDAKKQVDRLFKLVDAMINQS